MGCIAILNCLQFQWVKNNQYILTFRHFTITYNLKLRQTKLTHLIIIYVKYKLLLAIEIEKNKKTISTEQIFSSYI